MRERKIKEIEREWYMWGRENEEEREERDGRFRDKERSSGRLILK